jgi:hypothetical protein
MALPEVDFTFQLVYCSVLLTNSIRFECTGLVIADARALCDDPNVCCMDKHVFVINCCLLPLFISPLWASLSFQFDGIRKLSYH